MIDSVKLGNSYWVLTDLEHSYVLGQHEFDSVVFCLFKNLAEMDGLIKYCFYPVNTGLNSNETFYELTEWEIEQLIFNSIDEYLYYLVAHVENLNTAEQIDFDVKDGIVVKYEFDDFLKQKILESQEKHPELWI